jgi:aspartate-semialdehyde dehydrogenase
MRIGVIGATGTLGREVVAALAEAATEGGPSVEPPLLFATARSIEEEIAWVGEEELEVEEFTAELARGLDGVVVCTPEKAAKGLVDELRRRGVPAVDASRAQRASAPLAFVSPPAVGTPVVALPGPEALLVGRLVAPLLGLNPKWVRAQLWRPSSAVGQAGIRELAESSAKLLNGQEPETPREGHRLAFNLVPQAGGFTGDACEAELDLAAELPRLLGRTLPLAATVGLGPWFYGYFGTVSVGFGAPGTSPDVVREALRKGDDVKVLDDPSQSVYPMPSLATGDEAVLAGRVRADPIEPGAVQLVASMDGVRSAAVLAVRTVRALAGAGAAH